MNTSIDGGKTRQGAKTTADNATGLGGQPVIDAVGSGVDHFIPGLGIDKSTSGNTAHIGLVYYYYPVSTCSLSTCELDVGFVSSTDGGTTFSNTLQLAGPMQLSWLPQSELGLIVGDYIATAFSVGEAHPVFAVASAPGGGVACSSPGAVCHEAIFTVSGGLKPM